MYLNVLISPARISGCTKGPGRPFGAAGGGGGSLTLRPRSMGEFSLWLRERAATMVIYLMRESLPGREGEGRRGVRKRERRRGDGRVKERARIVSARAWGERKCVEKQWPAASPRAPPRTSLVRMKT